MSPYCQNHIVHIHTSTRVLIFCIFRSNAPDLPRGEAGKLPLQDPEDGGRGGSGEQGREGRGLCHHLPDRVCHAEVFAQI